MKIPKCQETSRHYKLLLLDLVLQIHGWVFCQHLYCLYLPLVPYLLSYGILIIASVSVCIAVTLGEMALAMPSAGGQYVWARVLAPKNIHHF